MKSQQSVPAKPVLIVTGGLCLVAALLGLRLGAVNLSMTESDVIDSAVNRWQAETGEVDTTTCIGRALVEEEMWLEVRCGTGSSVRTYRFDERGKLREDRNAGL
jgi:hypothetical protein